MIGPAIARGRARKTTEIAVFAAAYAALTVVLSPISYGPIQFRLAEMLKAAVIRRPHLIAAIAVGTFFGNLASPYVGPWELLFMPLTDALGGLIAWVVGRRFAALGAAAYALTTAGSVSFMLWQLGVGPFGVLFPGILVSEMILLIAGLPIMQTMLSRVDLAFGRRHREKPAAESAADAPSAYGGDGPPDAP